MRPILRKDIIMNATVKDAAILLAVYYVGRWSVTRDVASTLSPLRTR